MRKGITDSKSLLPLMPAEFQILLSLTDKPRHGYGIMAEVKDRTAGQVALGPGTLYGTIKRLVARGLVAETDQRVDPDMGTERRRYYKLTREGRRLATAEAARMADLVGQAVAKNLISDPRNA